MLSRGLTCALRLRSRALSASVPSNRPLLAVPEAPALAPGAQLFEPNAFSTSSVCGIFAAGGSLQQEASSSRSNSSKPAAAKAPGIAGTPPKLDFPHDPRSMAAEQALVTRLAGIWGMPPEVLASNVAMLSEMLKPCGRDTAAHALWVLVRCPPLRHMSDQQVRHVVRSLHERFPDIPKSAFKATVYKHPWVLNAQLPRGSPHATAAPTAAADSAGLSPDQQQQQKVAVTPWKQELAMLLLEMQCPDNTQTPDSPPAAIGTNDSSMVRASPAAALAAVRLYLAAAEARQLVQRGLTWFQAVGSPGSRAKAPAAGSSAAAAKAAVPASHSAADGPIKPTPPSSAGSSATDAAVTASPGDLLAAALQRTQIQQQFHVQGFRSLPDHTQQLQKVLYMCPSLTVLPPELLTSRWQLLLSVLLGQAESAAAVVVTNPYLMIAGYGYSDKGQQGGSGGGLSDWDYGQLAGLV